MFDILTLIPGKKKIASKGWHSFNGVCCHHLGHRPDDRGRAGIVFENETDWTYHCFNCGFSTKFVLGKSLPYKVKQLLQWCGIDQSQIDRWSFESIRNRSLLDIIADGKPKWKIKFQEVALPDTAVPIDVNDPTHGHFINFLKSRGYEPNDFNFMVSPNDMARNRNRIIIPYTFRNKNVGYISRYLDNRTPKYIKNQQVGYVFGYDQQKPEYEVCLVFEGVLDAIALNGCAVTHDSISDEQAEVLRSLHRTIIVVPDMDKNGLAIVDRALDLGFKVALPDWGSGIKDANDAVLKYGKLPTLLSILNNATNSKIKIEMQRKKIAQRI